MSTSSDSHLLVLLMTKMMEWCAVNTEIHKNLIQKLTRRANIHKHVLSDRECSFIISMPLFRKCIKWDAAIILMS